MVFQGWVHFLQIEMVLKINKRLLRLFLQLKIIWGLGVLNNFNAFFHPCFPCFINGRWQETGAANIFLFRMQDLGRGDGGKLGISYLCCFLGFCFMSPPKKTGRRRVNLEICKAAVSLVKTNIFRRKVAAGRGPYPAFHLATLPFISTALARLCCTGETAWTGKGGWAARLFTGAAAVPALARQPALECAPEIHNRKRIAEVPAPRCAGGHPPATCHPLSFHPAGPECGWFGARKHLFD